MKKLPAIAVILICIAISGCAPTELSHESDGRQADLAGDVKAVAQALEEYGLKVYERDFVAGKVVASTQRDGATVVVTATPDKDGRYPQTVTSLGGGRFVVRATIYTCVIGKRSITVEKSVCEEGSPTRTDASVEQELVDMIAARTSRPVRAK